MNTAEWLDTFSKSPRLAVVDRIASDLANTNGKLLRVNPDGTETEITDHRFLDFMAQPNPLYEMTSSAMWRLHEIYLLLVGESFFLIERDDFGRPVELWVVPPHWVKMTPYLGNPNYTIVSTGGLTMNVPVEDMFVMKQLNPLDPFMRGLGIAESIADEVEIDEYAAKFQKRFFYNDATPPVVFVMPNSTKEQREEFMARWNKKHKGVENSHRAAALSGDVTVKELGSTDGKNLGFIESREAMRDAVLEHFGVPREIMGITENSNRSTADAAQYIYAKNVLTPRLIARETAINNQLLPMFGENLIWRYDPVIPYDKAFDKEKAFEGWREGLLTKNEARRLIDMPDVDGGDVFKIGINDLYLNETDDPADVTQAMLQEDMSGPVPGTKASRRLNVTAMLRKETQAIRKNERLFEVAVMRHFTEQKSAIASALGNKAKSNLFSPLSDYLLPDGTFNPELWAMLSDTEKQKLTEGIADGLLDWNAEAEKLARLLSPLWKKTYDDGTTISEESYGIVDIDRPEFVTPVKINGGKRIVGIENTTRAKIADIIARGVSEGSSQSQLKNAIQSEMGTTKTRAKLIARQETMTALATGQFDMMKSAGATTKTWHHRPQKNPRDGIRTPVNHVALDGETVGIDEKFSNGLRYPRDPNDGRAEEVINCRCYLTYGFESARQTSETVDISQNTVVENQFATQGYVGLNAEESDQFMDAYHNEELLKNGRNANDRKGEESGHIVYSGFNKRVREGTTTAADEVLMAELDAAINANSLPQQMTLYRGTTYKVLPQLDTSGKTLEKIKEEINAMKGSIIATGDYVQVSASSLRNYYTDSDICMQIIADEGTPAYISNYRAESEIVLGRNTKLEILGADIIKNVKDIYGDDAGDRITLIVRVIE